VVTVVRDGSFLGVITEREEVALRAADLLRADAKWHEAPTLPDEDDLPAFLTSAPAETRVLAESPPPSSAAPTPAARSHEATYHRPYLAHAAMGPSTATALASTAPAGDEAGVRLKVWTHSQGVPAAPRAGPGAEADREPGAGAARGGCGLLRSQRRR
jgi:nicotinate dehydrogenase subunit B